MKNNRLKLLAEEVFVSKIIIQNRLEYIRKQIEECEGSIPSRLWCDDCKERTKKMQHLVDKLKMKTKVRQSERSYSIPEMLKDVYGPATVSTSTYPEGTRYHCLECGAHYDKREQLNLNNCAKCGSDNIVYFDGYDWKDLNENE